MVSFLIFGVAVRANTGDPKGKRDRTSPSLKKHCLKAAFFPFYSLLPLKIKKGVIKFVNNTSRFVEQRTSIKDKSLILKHIMAKSYFLNVLSTWGQHELRLLLVQTVVSGKQETGACHATSCCLQWTLG
jgi:hypothetical protein